MNAMKPVFLVSVAAVLAGGALAQPGSNWTPCGHGAVDCEPLAPIESTLTREEVRAEMKRAQREGRIVNGDLAVLHEQLRPAPARRGEIGAIASGPGGQR